LFRSDRRQLRRHTAISMGLMRMSSRGMGNPSSTRLPTYSSIASRMFAIPSSIVSLCVWQPGRVGQNTWYPPSSSFSKITVNRCAIASLRRLHSIPPSSMLAVNLLRCLCQQLLQTVLPKHGPGVAAVAVSVFAQRDEDVLAVLEPLGFALGDAQFWRIDEVVGRVHPHNPCGDFLELWRRIIVARSVHLIEEVVRVR